MGILNTQFLDSDVLDLMVPIDVDKHLRRPNIASFSHGRLGPLSKLNVYIDTVRRGIDVECESHFITLLCHHCLHATFYLMRDEGMECGTTLTTEYVQMSITHNTRRWKY
jgi:hypothetical protein